MKVKVIKKSFYDNKLNNIGEIIEIKEKELPSWAEAIEEIETENKDDEVNDTPEVNGDLKDEEKEVLENTPAKTNERLDELEKLSEDELKEKLDTLLNETIDKDIIIDFDNKSDIQLIIELEDMLMEKE